MTIRIALAGNPNCGKTTMFNQLTGSSQYVGNWPGVTVEKKEGKLKGHKGEAIVMDLPGIYSLSPYTLEEVVSRNYLMNDKPDVIINLVDASNIERNLYLTTQLLEVGIPVVIALNMIDIVEKRGDQIDVARLQKQLGCPIIKTSALKGTGLNAVSEKAIELAAAKKKTTVFHKFDQTIETALIDIEEILNGTITDEKQLRWFAVKVFERDEKVMAGIQLNSNEKQKIEEIISSCEQKMDDDSESIITNERYTYIGKIIKDSVKKTNKTKLSVSDKIDKVVTNRWLALPIFAAVMWLVYFVSVSTVGGVATDWANDGVFGDGWHLLGIGSGQYDQATEEYELETAKIDAYLNAAEEAGVDTEAVGAALEFEPDEDMDDAAIAASEAENDEVIQNFVIMASAANISATLDIKEEDGKVEKTLPVSIADFETALEAEEPNPANYGVWVTGIPVLVENGLNAVGCADWLQGLILDGVIGGVGAVLGFVPQMLILFLFLAILEDCGYMARIAFIMDRIFRKFGLSGKSFIPMLIGTGCGVPGIMASRTIENEKDRKMTIMVTTFIPCGAKLPIIALIAGALFPNSTWVGPSAYFIGIGAIILSGIILKKTRLFAGDPAPFVMELPSYHVPGVKGVLIHMWDRGKSFIQKAGTIIFVACGLIWFMSNFNWSLHMVEESDSILASIGNVIAPIFTPLGFGDWKAAVATVTGLVAKENVVGTFGVLYGIGEVAEDGIEIWGNLAAAFTQVSAYAFLVFNLLCAPCFAAIGAIKREMGNWKWTMIAVGYQCLLAYAAAFIINQLGSVLVLGTPFGVGTVISLLLIGVVIWLLFRKSSQRQNRLSKSAVSYKA